MMMKKYFKIYIPALALIFIVSAMPVFAVCDPKTGIDSITKKRCYVPLEPNAFPGVTNTSDLGVFLGQLFKWGISVAVALSLVMVIWGGIEYMTTDSWSGKDDGKTKIWNAFLGLGLALVSWLLLYTINPCLVDFTGSAGCKSANTLLGLSTSGQQSTNTDGSSANGDISTNTSTNNNIIGGNTSAGNSTTGSASSPTSANSTGSGTNTSGSSSGCSNCIDIRTLGIALKSGAGYELNTDLAYKLQTALLGQNVRVTEAYPSKTEHISGCHDNGTCADVNFINGSTDVNDVRNLYSSLRNAGLNANYEVGNINDCQKYKDIVGMLCNTYTTTTGSHFHVTM